MTIEMLSYTSIFMMYKKINLILTLGMTNH